MPRLLPSKSFALLLVFGVVLPAAASEALAFSGNGNQGLLFQSPAVITDQSRHPPYYNDFLREIYVTPQTPPVNMVGKPNGVQLRAFFGDTRFYFPPITPAAIASYAGGPTNPAYDLVVMECRPTDIPTVDPELITWPILAQLLLQDITPPSSCSPLPASTAAQAWCLAKAFVDISVNTATTPVVTTLYNAIKLGKDLFAINSGDGANLLYDLYGIGYGHSGLGFAVNGSVSGNFNAAQTLQESIVPEYLLENVTLEQAHCHCVRIPSYNNRDDQPLSPAFVWSRGSLDDGDCRIVNRISNPFGFGDGD
jgi:hypothetical protein